VARLAQDQERSAIFYFKASVSLDEFCAAFDGVHPSPVSPRTLKRRINYLPE
jgi:hypothetical protein